MKTEKINIELTRFFDSAGNETCAVDFTKETGFCEFYRTRLMGTQEYCLFDLEKKLDRREDSKGEPYGNLIPCENCIMKRGSK